MKKSAQDREIEKLKKQVEKLKKEKDLKSATIIQYTIKGRFMSR